MADTYYRLELLVAPEAKDLYKPIENRSDDNAGFDLFVAEDYEIRAGEVTLMNLGCKARMVRCFLDSDKVPEEEDVHFTIYPRSSIWKSGVTQANSVGVIDKSYRGTLMGAVVPIYKPTGYWSKTSGTAASGSYVWMNCDSRDTGNPIISKGQRLFQIVAPEMGWIKEVRLVETLSETVRGEGGFGSTGK